MKKYRLQNNQFILKCKFIFKGDGDKGGQEALVGSGSKQGELISPGIGVLDSNLDKVSVFELKP